MNCEKCSKPMALDHIEARLYTTGRTVAVIQIPLTYVCHECGHHLEYYDYTTYKIP